MAIAPNTAEFAKLRQEVNEGLDQGIITSEADLSKLLESYDLSTSKFFEVLKDYESQSEFQKRRANETTFDAGKFAAKGAAELLSVVPNVALGTIEAVGGKEARKATEEAAKDVGGYLEGVLPKSVVYAAKETIDPNLNVAEEIASEVIAIGNLQSAMAKGVAKVFPNLLNSRIGKFSTFFGTEVAADVALRDKEEQFTPAIAELLDYGVDNLVETEEEKIAGQIFDLSPEAATYIQALEIDPNDNLAKRKLKQIVDASLIAGVAGATLAGLIKGGGSIIRKSNELIDSTIQNTRRPTSNLDGVTSDVKVTRVGPNNYEYRGKVKETVGKINTMLGRGLASKSALPTDLFRAEMRKRNFAKSQQLEVDKDGKKLIKLIKKNNLTPEQEEIINRIWQGENLSFNEIQDIPEDIVNLALKMRSNVNANQQKIKDKLGLKDYGQLGLRIEKGKRKEVEAIINVLKNKPNARLNTRDTVDLYQSLVEDITSDLQARGTRNPSIKKIHKEMLSKLEKGKLGQAFTDKDGVYFTYSYEIFTNPNWNKKIMQAIQGELDTTNPMNQAVNRKVRDAQAYIGQQLNTTNQDVINGTINELLEKVQGKDNIMGMMEILNPDVGIGANVQKVLKGRKDIPEPILNLMGRVDDPARNYIETMWNQNSLIAKADFYNFLNDYARQNMGKEIELGGLIPGAPKATTTFSKDVGLQSGVKKQYDLGQLAARDLGAFGAPGQKLGLANILTTKEMFDMVNNGIDTFALNKPASNVLLKVINRPMAYAQAAETVFDQQAHALNIYGGVQSLAANGYLLDRNLLKNSQDALLTLMSKYSEGEEEAVKFVNLLMERGLLDSNPISEGVKQNLRKQTPAGRTSIERAREEGVDLDSMKEILGDVVNYLPQKTSELYGMPDDLMKMIGVLSEQQKLKRIFPNASNQEIFDRAVDTVLDVFPSYTNASAFVRALANIPVGNYAVFPIESARNLKNITKIGYRDMVEGLRTNNPALARHGARRLLSIGATLSAFGAYGLWTNSSMGVTEDNKRAVDIMAPGWQKSSVKWFTEPFTQDQKTGEIYTRYIDSGALDTYQYGKAPVMQILKLALEGKELTDREIDDIFGQIGVDVFSPYFSEKRLPSAVLNVLRDVNEKGQKQNRTAWENVKEVTKPFIPGLINSFVKEGQAYESEKLLGEGKGITAKGYPNRLEDAKLATRTGIRNNTVNITKSIGYSIREDSNDIKAVDQRVGRLLSNIPVKELSASDIEKIMDEYISLQADRREAMARMKDKMKVLSNITFQKKLKDGTIITERLADEGVLAAISDMGDRKISRETKYVISNQFIPSSLNDSQIKNMLVDKSLPPELIRQIKFVNNKMTGIPLREDKE